MLVDAPSIELTQRGDGSRVLVSGVNGRDPFVFQVVNQHRRELTRLGSVRHAELVAFIASPYPHLGLVAHQQVPEPGTHLLPWFSLSLHESVRVEREGVVHHATYTQRSVFFLSLCSCYQSIDCASFKTQTKLSTFSFFFFLPPLNTS